MNHRFEPTRAAALARLDRVNPPAYARSRNALDGAVTRLSPYITHGLLSTQQVLQAVHVKHPLAIDHKFVYELGWREYFQHVWQHRGDGIFESIHPGPLPDRAYAATLPDDIAEGRTGVPVIDMAVRTLYATGYLHNHARMWLASYVVHVRRVHWRAGADWLYGHLLDGDLASNHLSWQWVAGTGSHKPYLFNAENVAKYAPVEWHSATSAIDLTYEAMNRRAFGGLLPEARPQQRPAGAQSALWQGQVPALCARPPGFESTVTPRAHGEWSRVDASLVANKTVRLIHPWSLGDAVGLECVPPQRDSTRITLAVFPQELTACWPWSERRWMFVQEAMAQATPHLWLANSADLVAALRGAAAVEGQSNPHLSAAWQVLRLRPAAQLFAPMPRLQNSFSQYFRAATEHVKSIDELLVND